MMRSCGTSIYLVIYISLLSVGSFCVVSGKHSWRRKKKKREKLEIKRRIRLGAERHRRYDLVTLSRGENSVVGAENQNTVYAYLD